MIGARRSRWAGESVFESRTPSIRWQPGFMITAAATTAPHVGATTTSSTPATRARPSFQRRRSWRRVGTMTVIGHQGSRSRRAARARESNDPAGAGSVWAVTPMGLAPGPPLAERRGLADALPEEVQLRPSNLAVADNLDLLDPRAVDLERPLDADAARDPADRDRAGDAAATKPHHGPLEDLDPLAIALDDLGRHLDRVTRGELGEVGAELVGDDFVEDGHWRSLSAGRQQTAAGRFGRWPD